MIYRGSVNFSAMLLEADNYQLYHCVGEHVHCHCYFLLKSSNSFQAQRWHQGNEHFGRSWLAGDVVGCMVDMNEHTMMFTLNGEILLDDSGSELAFKDFEVGDGKYCNTLCR